LLHYEHKNCIALSWKFSSFFSSQIINVYNQEYESGAQFWPDVHRRIIIALIVSQILFMGLMSTYHAASSTPLILVLPVLTIWFHFFCKSRFEPAFVQYPLQVFHLFFFNTDVIIRYLSFIRCTSCNRIGMILYMHGVLFCFPFSFKRGV
jgi:Calcium-dependent channel, 7TM region, putative phosphate